MKHTLNVLTLTALAAAASAQTAPAAPGLNYNNITASRFARQNALSLQLALGQSNFVAGVATSDDYETDGTYGQLSAGYVFKGVTQGIDATVGVIQTNFDATVYTIEIRRQLNEVYQGLEISAGYASTLSSGTEPDGFIFGGYSADNSESCNYIGLTYNINKTFAVGVSLNKPSNTNYDRATVFSVRAGF